MGIWEKALTQAFLAKRLGCGSDKLI